MTKQMTKQQLTFKSLTQKQKEYICNGCGPKELFQKFGEIELPKFLQFKGCEEHDFDYYVGYTAEDRLKADRKLLISACLEALKHIKIWEIITRLKIAFAYYGLVRELGHRYFNFDDHRITLEELEEEMSLLEDD